MNLTVCPAAAASSIIIVIIFPFPTNNFFLGKENGAGIERFNATDWGTIHNILYIDLK